MISKLRYFKAPCILWTVVQNLGKSVSTQGTLNSSNLPPWLQKSRDCGDVDTIEIKQGVEDAL